MREEWQERREDLKWEPRRRVHIAVQKLRGADPVSVLLQDLQANPAVRKEKSLSSLESIVRASACCGSTDREDVRMQLQALPVGAQVDQLLNIATDPDVLVRQWAGLQTWL